MHFFKVHHQIKPVHLFLTLGLVCFGFLSQAQLIINGPGTVLYSNLSSADKILAKSSGIIVEKGGHLDINQNILFIGAQNINVNVGDPNNPGGILELHSTITLRSVTVYGEYGTPHFNVIPDNTVPYTKAKFYGVLNPIHGRVSLGLGCVINGEMVSFLGGIIESFEDIDGTGPVINNNLMLLRIDGTKQSPSAIRLNNVSFNLKNIDQNYSPDLHLIVWINESNDIFFGGCRFTNIDNSRTSTFYGRGEGIVLTQYSFGPSGPYDPSSIIVGEAGNVFYKDPGYSECVIQKVDGKQLQTFKSEFHALSTGILTYDPNDEHLPVISDNISVSNTSFYDNFRDIDVSTVSADIHDCSFESNDFDVGQQFTSLAFTGNDMRMIKIDGTEEVFIYNNTFAAEALANDFGERHSSIELTDVGGNTQGVAKKILVRNNIINGNTNTTVDAKYGIVADGDLRNFEWMCNNFSNDNIDVSYSGVGPNRNPYTPNRASRNIYSSGAQYKIENASSKDLEYRRTSFGILTPVNDQSKFTFTQVFDDGPCEIKCDELEDIRNNLDDGTIKVNDVKKEDIRLYPNPANTTINWATNEAIMPATGTIKLVNAFGVQVGIWDLSELTSSIDVSHITEGLYVLYIEGEGKTFSKRIIVSR